MYDAFRIRDTDEISVISSSDTPPIASRDDEIEEYKNQRVFEAISGRCEDITDKDTVQTAIIVRKEYRSQFIGIRLNALGLCRSATWHHCGMYLGILPEYIHIAGEAYNDLKKEMEYIYGEFQGKLPPPITLHHGKTISIKIDNNLSKNTVVCIHWLLEEYREAS